MSYTFRYETLLRRGAWLAVVCGLLAGLGLAYRYSGLPFVSSGGQGGGTSAARASWPLTPSLAECKWSVFSPQQNGGQQGGPGSLASRYRLAGTFFWSGKEDGVTIRKAILDNLQTKEGHIVAEGDFLGDIEVVRVLMDSVVLRAYGHDEELRLSYASAPQSASAAGQGVTNWLQISEDETVLSTNLYGAQVGETRWVMSRDKMEGYCVEMEDHPARLAALFDSMKPVYETDPTTAARTITGYQLGIEGEGDFYNAVGLKEGDIVNGVNQMPMTSKRRAMFWIDQFRQSHVNTFMIDVVRDGKPMRLEYLIR